MLDSLQIANYIDYFIQILLGILFIYLLFDRFVKDMTIYDLMTLRTGHADKITFKFEPVQLQNEQNSETIFTSADLYLSIIIPTNNMISTISSNLETIIQYFFIRSSDSNFTWEIIVSDDGSFDGTPERVLEFCSKYSCVHLLRQQNSLGVGASIQAAVSYARGRYIFVIDPNFSSLISEFSQLESQILLFQINPTQSLIEKNTISNHLNSNVPTLSYEENTFSKNQIIIFGKRLSLKSSFPLYSLFTSILGVSKDTSQVVDFNCIFFLVNRQAARMIFPNLHTTDQCFLFEMYYLAKRMTMNIDFLTIQGGSTSIQPSFNINPFMSLISMSFFYPSKLWSIKNKSTIPNIENEV